MASKEIKPKKYYTLKADYGEAVADKYLSLCEKLEPLFTGPITYRASHEAHQFALTVVTGKTFEEREAERIAGIDWDYVNQLMIE